MRYLTVDEWVALHCAVIAQTGGADGIRDLGALASAAAQPQAGFGGQEFYPTLADKAAAPGFAIIKNHPCIDGNKRLGNNAIEVFLVLNGHEIAAGIDERETVILAVAAGTMGRDEFAAWVRSHVVPCAPGRGGAVSANPCGPGQ